MRTTMLGQDIAFPIAVAPTSMHCLAHNDGELATARAVGSVGTGMILSAGTNSTMEDVAAALFPNGLRWAQLYIFKDLSLVRRIVKKAETNGYGALVVTIDYPVSNKGPWGSLRIPPHIKMANFADVELSRLSSVVINESVTWKDIDWLHSITSLPIVLKGIRTGEMAREALNHNIAGIVVSNTGGRNLDGLPATIDALSEVVEAVRGSCMEVYLDGGVRTGTDVLKALALGARAVFIGRPIIWGLAYDGEAGARTVLEIIRDEFSLAMALSGCPKLSDITPDLVIRDLRYSAKL
ncbi:hydroxyacid oxidase 1-like isoform X2 [Patiria miniata]|nr:hydroxyacid oxidase 1-like isoform X2 [Patiria miniata]XP_038072862.1 hydroxyacid oxidase 1-like isoform X2 [Patiria miniata]